MSIDAAAFKKGMRHLAASVTLITTRHRELRGGLGRRPGLIPIPLSLLETALRVAGRNEIYHRLAGSLVADPSAISRLGWAPTVTTPEGLAALARG